jgi:hypothetical protein
MLIAWTERPVSDRPNNATHLKTYAGMMNDSTLDVKLSKHEELSKCQEFPEATR